MQRIPQRVIALLDRLLRRILLRTLRWRAHVGRELCDRVDAGSIHELLPCLSAVSRKHSRHGLDIYPHTGVSATVPTWASNLPGVVRTPSTRRPHLVLRGLCAALHGCPTRSRDGDIPPIPYQSGIALIIAAIPHEQHSRVQMDGMINRDNKTPFKRYAWNRSLPDGRTRWMISRDDKQR